MAIQEDITLRLKIDKSDITSNLNDITSKINELKTAQSKLNQDFKDGKIAQDQYSIAAAKLKMDISNLTGQQNLAVKAVQAGKGSMDELTAALNLNRKAYSALSQEERENVNVGGKLKKTINDQGAALQDLNAKVGKPGLRGGITEAFSGMGKSLGVAALAFVSIEGVAKAFTFTMEQSGTAMDTFKQTSAGVSEGLKSIARDLINVNFKDFIQRALDAAAEGANIEKLQQNLNRTKITQDLRILDNLGKIGDKQAELAKLAVDDIKNQPAIIKYQNEILALRQDNVKILEDLAVAQGNLNIKTLTNTVGETSAKNIQKYIDVIKTYSVEETTLFNSIVESNQKWYTAFREPPNVKLLAQYGVAPEQIKIIQDTYKANVDSLLETRRDFEKKFNVAQGRQPNEFVNLPLDVILGYEKFKDLNAEVQSSLIQGYKDIKVAQNASTDAQITSNAAIAQSQLKLDRDAATRAAATLAAKAKNTAEQLKLDEEIKKAGEEGAKDGAKWAADEIKRIEDLQQKKIELQKEYDDYIANEKQIVAELNAQESDNQWERDQAKVQLEYEVQLDAATKERDILISKLTDQEDFYIKKRAIEKAYGAEALALEKKRASESLQIASDRRQFEIGIVMGWASSISGITDQLDAKQREAKYASLIIESAASIADIWINYSVASAKGFSQLGPILGIPAATAMTIAAGISTAAVVAKTATGLAAINSAGKSTSSIDKPVNNNAQYGGKFALGGGINGGSHAQGGVLIEAEGGEYIINKKSMENPIVARIASMINKMGVGGPIFPYGIPTINDPINPHMPGFSPIINPGTTSPAIDYAQFTGSTQGHPDTFNAGLNIGSSRGYSSFINRGSTGMNYSGGSFGGSYGGSSFGSSSLGNIDDARIAEIASKVLGSIPVYVVESEMTGVQKRAQVREAKFVI